MQHKKDNNKKINPDQFCGDWEDHPKIRIPKNMQIHNRGMLQSSLAAFHRLFDIRRYVVMAHDHGIKAHIGKAGTGKTYTLAASAGADSCDGSTPMRHNNLDRIEKWRIANSQQRSLSAVV